MTTSPQYATTRGSSKPFAEARRSSERRHVGSAVCVRAASVEGPDVSHRRWCHGVCGRRRWAIPNRLTHPCDR
jgi:hypothetical protein